MIFATGTYIYLAQLVFVFLVTDLLRYKPVIVLDGISAIVTWCLLIWGKGVQVMQVMIVIGFHYFFSFNFQLGMYTWRLIVQEGIFNFCILQRNIECIP